MEISRENSCTAKNNCFDCVVLWTLGLCDRTRGQHRRLSLMYKYDNVSGGFN